MAKVFQVREKIGTLYHVYAEFKHQQDALHYMSALMDTSKFDIPVVNTNEPAQDKR
jgi:hypothetical protein